TISFEAFPRDAVIFGTIKPAARTAAGEKPRLPARLPERREHDVRIMRIENDIDAASVFVFGQNFRPCFAAVTRAKDATLLIWAAISRLPNPARNRAEIICIRLTYDTFDRQRSSSAKRPNLSPTHAIEQLFINRDVRWLRGSSGSN